VDPNNKEIENASRLTKREKRIKMFFFRPKQSIKSGATKIANKNSFSLSEASTCLSVTLAQQQ